MNPQNNRLALLLILAAAALAVGALLISDQGTSGRFAAPPTPSE